MNVFQHLKDTGSKRLGALAFALILIAGRPASAELIVGLTDGNQLVRFDSSDPTTILGATGGITGLVGLAEAIVAIDYRPANQVLYGLGSSSRIYTIDAFTGVATVVGGGQFNPLLSGSAFGFDFNPTVDRIRLVNNDEQNLRLNPNTGAVAVEDPDLAYASGDPNFGANPQIVGAAYTNSVPGATSTTLYGIDSGLDVLVRHTVAPGFAQLVTVGDLGFDFDTRLGFDISGATGTAFVGSHNPGDAVSRLFTIDLATGTSTEVGFIGGANSGIILRGLSVVAVPEPASLAMAGIGVLGVVGMTLRRRRAGRA